MAGRSVLRGSVLVSSGVQRRAVTSLVVRDGGRPVMHAHSNWVTGSCSPARTCSHHTISISSRVIVCGPTDSDQLSPHWSDLKVIALVMIDNDTHCRNLLVRHVRYQQSRALKTAWAFSIADLEQLAAVSKIRIHYSTTFSRHLKICFCRAMRGISAAYVGIRCPSVTFVDHVKTNKHIFKIFAPSGSHTILVFPY